jgi:hypothetical protein
VILRLAFAVFPIGVDEEDVVAPTGTFLAHDEDAGGNPCPVEQARRQADHGVEIALVDDVPARLALLAAPEQHAVRHHRRHAAVALEHGQHVLNEHQIRLLALLGHEDLEALRPVHPLADVVLAERRVGEDAIEPHELAVLAPVLRGPDRILLPDVGRLDVVEDHVHLADGPGGADLLLARQNDVARVAAGVADVVACLDQHAARPGGRVVDRHAGLRVDDLDHGADDLGRGVELAGLLAGAVGEILDQVFVGGTEQVRELEVLVLERDLLEGLDEVDQRFVVERALADLPVEVDVLEHVLEYVLVVALELAERLVEGVADVLLEMTDRLPARHRRHVEGVAVAVLRRSGDSVLGHAPALQALDDPLALLIEEVTAALQEQDAEDVFLVLGRVHVAAQLVAGLEEEGGELCEGELLHGDDSSFPVFAGAARSRSPDAVRSIGKPTFR